VCGEQSSRAKTMAQTWGSPPRVRGTVNCAKDDSMVNRITPACAGNRAISQILRLWVEDHPRVCGEQLRLQTIAARLVGSPPRVRGTDALIDEILGSRRITPACAGNSRFFDTPSRVQKDHPRVCGEQQTGTGMGPAVVGSPPRVRGTVALMSCPPAWRGITPACAGNREIKARVSGKAADHPRVCGEQPK